LERAIIRQSGTWLQWGHLKGWSKEISEWMCVCDSGVTDAKADHKDFMLLCGLVYNLVSTDRGCLLEGRV